MLLISYEHYEHFNYKLINSISVISYELWTVSYSGATMTSNSNHGTAAVAAVAATASVARRIWSASVSCCRVVASIVCSLIQSHYYARLLSYFPKNYDIHATT